MDLRGNKFKKTRVTVSVVILELFFAYGLFVTLLNVADIELAK